MSYCINQEELDRRGLCPDTVCAPPSFIRETIIEPSIGPIFDDTPFSSSPVPWSGGGRWFGGGGRPRRRPSWQPNGPPQHHGTPGPGNTANRPGRPVNGPLDRSPKDDFPRRPALTASIAYAQTTPSHAAQRYQAASPTYTVRPVARPAQQYQAAPTTYTARPMAPSPAQVVHRAPPTYSAMPVAQQTYRAQSTSRGMKGLGQMVSDGYRPNRPNWMGMQILAGIGLASAAAVGYWTRSSRKALLAGAVSVGAAIAATPLIPFNAGRAAWFVTR